MKYEVEPHSCPAFHEGDWGRGGVAPTHSRPQHYMGVSGQCHARPRLKPGEGTTVPIVQEAGWTPEPVWTERLEEKSFCLCRRSNLDRQVVQAVTRHCTN
jgi:hypothetical protein